jgi:hypothetical protein
MTDITRSEVVALLRSQIAKRAHAYFPDLSDKISIEVLHQSRPWLRKHSVLFEILVLDCSKQTSRGIFVKIPRYASDNAIELTYHTLRDLYDYSLQLPDDLNVVRPLDFLPELRAIVTERVEGQSLDCLVRSQPDNALCAEIMNSCGCFLRLYHEGKGQITWESNLAESFLTQCSAYLEELEKDGVGKRERERIIAGFQGGIGLVRQSAPMVNTVKDFVVGNIVVQGKRIFFIEVTKPRRKTIYNDIAAFLNSLTMLYWKTPWFLLGSVPSPILTQRFLHGYFKGKIPLGLISLFSAQALCHQWHVALNSLSARRHGVTGVIRFIPLRLRINGFFYHHLMNHLQIASPSSQRVAA